MNIRIYKNFNTPSHPWPTQPDLYLSLFLEEPDGSEVFGQETDKEVYFYLNALDDSDKESDDTEDNEDIIMLVV